MTWKPAIIPATTTNPYTGTAPTRADLDTRLDTLNDQIGRPIRHVIKRDGSAYMLVLPFSAGDHEVMNLGKTVAQAHRALCVAIDMHHALR